MARPSAGARLRRRRMPAPSRPRSWRQVRAAASRLLVGAQAPATSFNAISAKLERETIAQIAPVGNNARDDATLGLIRDQHVELIELIHRDELKDLDTHRAVRMTRQLLHQLHPLRCLGA